MSGDHLLRGAQWQERAADLLAPITAGFPARKGVKVPWDDRVHLDLHRVERAAQCLAHAPREGAGGYVENAHGARRRVGAAVLDLMRSEGLDPVTAFARVVASPHDRFSDALAGWIELLGPGGRAALATEACSYAASLAAWDPLARLAPDQAEVVPVWQAGASNLDWQVPGRAVFVRGRVDVLAPRGARPAGRRILVHHGRDLIDPAAARRVAGHQALAYTLQRGSVPSVVAVLSPPSGSYRAAVDDDLLGEALEAVAAAAAAAVSARLGPVAAATPGAWCRGCGRRDECPEGTSWVAGHPVRFGGLLPLTD